MKSPSRIRKKINILCQTQIVRKMGQHFSMALKEKSIVVAFSRPVFDEFTQRFLGVRDLQKNIYTKYMSASLSVCACVAIVPPNIV